MRKKIIAIEIILAGCFVLLAANFAPSSEKSKTKVKNIALRSPTSADINLRPASKSKRKGIIKIATIGPRPLNVDINTEPQEVVNKMIAHWKSRFAQVLPDRPDLIVVPEACDRPSNFNLDKRLEYYRVRKDQIQNFFAKVAKENHCYIVYSAAREMEDGTWRNSSVLLDRMGKVAGIYNKNHVVIEETTKAGILCGRDAPVIDCDFGRVAFAICFDLNFDELRLKYVKAKPDLLIFSSMYHGGLMQPYWAYSCRCHFVGAINYFCVAHHFANFFVGEV